MVNKDSPQFDDPRIKSAAQVEKIVWAHTQMRLLPAKQFKLPIQPTFTNR